MSTAKETLLAVLKEPEITTILYKLTKADQFAIFQAIEDFNTLMGLPTLYSQLPEKSRREVDEFRQMRRAA